jgi:hypothetical protein
VPASSINVRSLGVMRTRRHGRPIWPSSSASGAEIREWRHPGERPSALDIGRRSRRRSPGYSGPTRSAASRRRDWGRQVAARAAHGAGALRLLRVYARLEDGRMRRSIVGCVENMVHHGRRRGALSAIIGMASAIDRNTVRLQSEQLSAFDGIRTVGEPEQIAIICRCCRTRAGLAASVFIHSGSWRTDRPSRLQHCRELNGAASDATARDLR